MSVNGLYIRFLNEKRIEEKSLRKKEPLCLPSSFVFITIFSSSVIADL